MGLPAEKIDKQNEKHPSSDQDTNIINKLQERQSQELVIAFCGAVGSGISKVADITKKIFEKEYNYKVEYIKVSDFIKEKSTNKKLKGKLSNYEKIKLLQQEGNKLRKEYGDNILAQNVIKKIAKFRGYDEKGEKIFSQI